MIHIAEKEITPLLVDGAVPRASFTALGEHALEVAWIFSGERVLRLVANLGPRALCHPGPPPDWGRRLYGLGVPAPAWSELPAWSVVFYLEEAA